MDNKTRVVRYANAEEVIELCKEIAALEKRLSAAESTINTMRNASQFYSAVTLSNDVAVGGMGGIIYTLSESHPLKYVPTKDYNDSK